MHYLLASFLRDWPDFEQSLQIEERKPGMQCAFWTTTIVSCASKPSFQNFRTLMNYSTKRIFFYNLSDTAGN